MSNLNLRKRQRISYYEPEEPNLDEYVFCADCADFVYEYCAIHGPLLVIPDDKVPAKRPFPPIVPRAALTIPHVFLHLAKSVIPGAGIGVFSTLTLPRGVRFGPYRGVKTNEINSTYCWQIYDGNKKPSHVIDAADANRSNWMRYVNCSRHWCEQNLIAYQYQGQIYYRTIKIVPRFTELMVYYGSEFANLLEVDLKRYNSPSSYAEKMGAMKTNKSAAVQKVKKFNVPAIKQQEIGTEIKNLPLVINTQESNLQKSMKPQDNIHKNKKNCSDFKRKTIKTHSTRKTKQVIKKNQSFGNTEYEDIIKNNSNKTTHLSDATDISNNKSRIKRIEVSNDSDRNETVPPIGILDDNKLSCDICPFQTYNKIYLTSHLKAHVGKSFDCDLCPYKTLIKASLTIHLVQHLGLRKFFCNICKKSFSLKSNLDKHIRTHTGIKPYKCNICEKSFSQKGDLVRHIRTHTGIKPYNCNICEKSFSQKSSLDMHIRTHTGIKPYKCNICEKSFSLKCNLDMHIRTHTGIKPYNCNICEKSFSQKNHLDMHIRTHTGIKPYKCNICEKSFSSKSNLVTHIRTHRG